VPGRGKVARFLNMAEISQKEQLALHEFSVRYRAALAKDQPTPEATIDTVKDAVREQYEQEMDAKRSPTVEPSSPSPVKERQPEPPEPEP
jgi:hypothetical protein